MRRRLFAEHLGLVDNAGNLDPNSTLMGGGRPASWLSLWNSTAVAALKHLQQGSQQPLPGFVLKFPTDDGGSLTTPRKHLAALGVDLKLGEAVVRPITGTRKFDFATGKWDKFPEHEDFVQ